jgi:hypothetical protein
MENRIGKEVIGLIRKAESQKRVGNVGSYEYMYSKVTRIDEHEMLYQKRALFCSRPNSGCHHPDMLRLSKNVLPPSLAMYPMFHHDITPKLPETPLCKKPPPNISSSTSFVPCLPRFP